MNFFLEIFHYVFEQPIYNILMAVFAVVHSFWFAIVVMTLLVRTAMIPLIFKQLQSSKVMQEIGPQIQQIQREYRSEPAVMQKKMSALYKENHINPYASCLPLLVQMPFIYGLYGAFNSILRDKHATAMSLNHDLYGFVRPLFGPQGLTHFPNTQFFGITLAQIDPTHILPILAALLTFIQLRMSLKRNQVKPKVAGGAPDPNAATMKMMQYVMPFFTLFIGWTFPAGLALYWIVTTAYSIVQQYFFNGRNWGGLLDGIPGFPQTAVSLAGTAGTGKIVDGSVSAPYKSRFARVTEEKNEEAQGNGSRNNGNGRSTRALPPARDAVDAGSSKVNTNGNNGNKPTTNGTNGNTPNGSKPVTRPNAARPATMSTRTPSTPIKAVAKRDAVRLVTPQVAGEGAKQNGSTGNGSSKTAGTMTVTRVPKATTTAPRVTISIKPKSAPAARARKKGR